jgi:hypothetical protein
MSLWVTKKISRLDPKQDYLVDFTQTECILLSLPSSAVMCCFVWMCGIVLQRFGRWAFFNEIEVSRHCKAVLVFVLWKDSFNVL